ncbi:hypothetical protein GCM10010435_44320 [Winogradskya consettensis]|uniref:Uncharacterized protein n=1 Tax=Winogradskya consettensis TaxID=113560 RepID=A0A919W110_9ACTN|nr:hypothetical protein [Actinoplanes consettensis]GIM82676.1 hypothetical protein Aco04nite_82710 [Actinoplanes consettensis]
MAARKPVVEDHPENSAQGQDVKKAAIAADTSTAETQHQVDDDHTRGFRGVEVDPTPNENYSVAGVTTGLPTPETDDDQADVARRALRTVETQVAGIAGR